MFTIIENEEIIYVCDYCGKKSSDSNEIDSCEAKDIGLSIPELHKYRVLEWRMDMLAAAAKNSLNLQKDLEEAKSELLKFEKKHSINCVEVVRYDEKEEMI